MDYEELSTYNLDSEFSQFYGWPLVEGPYFRKHFPQILLEYPVTNFFTSEQEVSKEIAFNNSIAPKLYYYHNNGPASIIGGQFISTENSWNEYYVFTDMHKDYFTLVKFNLDGSKVESLFHLKNTIDNQSPVISIEKNYDGDILAVFADGSVYKLTFELN